MQELFVWGLRLVVVFGILMAGTFVAVRAVLLAVRGALLWYWRIDEQRELLGEIRDLLRAQRVAVPPVPAAAQRPPSRLVEARVPAHGSPLGPAGTPARVTAGDGAA